MSDEPRPFSVRDLLRRAKFTMAQIPKLGGPAHPTLRGWNTPHPPEPSPESLDRLATAFEKQRDVLDGLAKEARDEAASRRRT